MIELETNNATQSINELSYGSNSVLGEEFKTENLHKSNGLVVSCEPEMLKQPLMKMDMTRYGV